MRHLPARDRSRGRARAQRLNSGGSEPALKGTPAGQPLQRELLGKLEPDQARTPAGMGSLVRQHGLHDGSGKLPRSLATAGVVGGQARVAALSEALPEIANRAVGKPQGVRDDRQALSCQMAGNDFLTYRLGDRFGHDFTLRASTLGSAADRADDTTLLRSRPPKPYRA
jgi:hypothetical protein